MPDFRDLRDADRNAKALTEVVNKLRFYDGPPAQLLHPTGDSIDEMFLAGQLHDLKLLLGLHTYNDPKRFEPKPLEVAELIAEHKLVADVYFVVTKPCDWMGHEVWPTQTTGFWDRRRNLHRGVTYVSYFSYDLDSVKQFMYGSGKYCQSSEHGWNA